MRDLPAHVCLGVPYIGPPPAPRRRWLAASLAAALVLGMAMLAIDEPVTLRVPAPARDDTVRIVASEVSEVAAASRPGGLPGLAIPMESEGRAVARRVGPPREVGILGSAALEDLERITGNRDLYGGLIGAAAGSLAAGYGYGVPGFGETARGGKPGVTIPVAELHLEAGEGYGTCDTRPPTCRGGMHGRTAAVPQARVRAGVVTTGADAAEIRRTVRRQLAKITYCYEKQLLSDRRLAGTVLTHFVIAADGHVAVATAAGVAPAVSSCIAGVIRAVRFRASGEVVEVSYPFELRVEP
jgi:hypothetical protein